MKKILIFFILFIYIAVMIPADAQKLAFEPIDHTYIYEVLDEGSVKCIWSTTILPKEPNILYPVSFRGGETKDYHAIDSLGKEVDIDVNEGDGQREIYLLLYNYEIGQPYQFNLSFIWNGLVARKESKHTIYTNVNLGEPQSAKIIVIPPKGAKMGASVVMRNNLSEPFKREMISGREALVWSAQNSGNDTEIPFRANFNYYNLQLSLIDNLPKILTGGIIIITAALLLGYRRRLPGIASRIKGLLKDGMR